MEEDGFLEALNTEAGDFCGVIPMTLHEQICRHEQKAEKLKGKAAISRLSFRSSNFSHFPENKSRCLPGGLPDSFVKDYDGIIADGAIRSGKTVCMSLSFVMWAMNTLIRSEFRHVRQDYRVLPAKCSILAETDVKKPGLSGGGPSCDNWWRCGEVKLRITFTSSAVKTRRITGSDSGYYAGGSVL